MFKSLRWRVAIAYLALVVVCMALLAAYLLSYVRESALQQQAVVGAALAIFIAAALAVLLAPLVIGVLTRPVAELTRMARGLAAGQLDQKVQVGSRDEVGELAEAFNLMSERLREMIHSVSNERNRMAAILSNMDDGVIIVDDRRRVSLLNRAARRILRISEGEHIGRSFVEVVRDHELAQLVQESIVGRNREEVRTKIVEMDAPRRILRAVVTPIREGESIRALVALQDLTELRRAEVVRREFVANVSHELRTPLASIKAIVETLRDGALEDRSVAHDFLVRMETEVDGLAQLVGELMELSRIESGQVGLKPEPTDVQILIAAAVDRLWTQADRSGIALSANVPADMPRVMADGERVEQVLVNLIHNAIKFTPPGGRVNVGATVMGSQACLSVSDTGTGIAVHDLPRIFERFYKADRSRASGGTGLGLAIAKHIVQAHGGEIVVESAPGQGATFAFTLPLV